MKVDFNLEEIYASKKGEKQVLKPEIISIACSASSVTAITASGRVFVWGERMGVYPPIEQVKGSFNELKEINSFTPRLLKDNLLHYKAKEAVSGLYT